MSAELAFTYAALILADEGVEITVSLPFSISVHSGLFIPPSLLVSGSLANSKLMFRSLLDIGRQAHYPHQRR